MAKINAEEMTPEQERMNLFRHGTRPSELTPNAIYIAACSDIRRKARNREILDRRRECRTSHSETWKDEAGNDRHKDECGTTEKYCFLTAHVEDAKTAEYLLAAALRWMAETDDKEREAAFVRTVTAMVYDSVEKLEAALEIAREAALICDTSP